MGVEIRLVFRVETMCSWYQLQPWRQHSFCSSTLNIRSLLPQVHEGNIKQKRGSRVSPEPRLLKPINSLFLFLLFYFFLYIDFIEKQSWNLTALQLKSFKYTHFMSMSLHKIMFFMLQKCYSYCDWRLSLPPPPPPPLSPLFSLSLSLSPLSSLSLVPPPPPLSLSLSYKKTIRLQLHFKVLCSVSLSFVRDKNVPSVNLSPLQHHGVICYLESF